jgi:hypothetical protein
VIIEYRLHGVVVTTKDRVTMITGKVVSIAGDQKFQQALLGVTHFPQGGQRAALEVINAV